MFSIRPLSDRSGHVVHGIGLGLLAFVTSYVSMFLLAVFYWLGHPWAPRADGLLAPGRNSLGYYIPGAVEMLQPHLPLAMLVVELRGSDPVSGIVQLILDDTVHQGMFPVAVLLPAASLVIAGVVVGYLHRRKSRHSSVILSAWLVAGYVVPLMVLSVSSLGGLRYFNYDGVDVGYVFLPSIEMVLLIIIYGIGLALLCGTLGVVLSGRIVDVESRETPTA